MELRTKKNDHLKYWRVIRYYTKARYNVSQADLDMILFLYSEIYFDRSKFAEFDRLLGWDRKRFDRLLKEGWVSVFRPKKGKYRTLYQLSYKGQRMVDMIYKRLSGEEIPASLSKNPMYLKNVGYNDKVYRNMITEMNDFIRQQQRHVPE